MINMGQHDSNNGGLHIIYTNIEIEDNTQTIVTGSSIHDCEGICLNGELANNVKIHNNVFYRGENHLI